VEALSEEERALVTAIRSWYDALTPAPTPHRTSVVFHVA
jgi:hypothetical protein